MLGGREADEERTKRSRLSASRSRPCRAWARIAWCMVGTAVVPRRLKRGQPSGEALGVKSGGTHDARARRERGNQGAVETMPVEQGHDIQASIGFFQRECRSMRVRRCAHADVPLRDDFRPRGRARRGQQHRGVAGADRLVGRCTLLVSGEREKTGRQVGGGRQLDDTDAPCERHAPRRGVKSSRREQCTRVQISEISVQFAGPVRRVQRSARCARRHGENRDRQFRTIRQHDRDPVMTAYPHRPQPALHLLDVPKKAVVGQRRAPGRKDRRCAGNTPRLMFEQVRQAEKRNGGPRAEGASSDMAFHVQTRTE